MWNDLKVGSILSTNTLILYQNVNPRKEQSKGPPGSPGFHRLIFLFLLSLASQATQVSISIYPHQSVGLMLCSRSHQNHIYVHEAWFSLPRSVDLALSLSLSLLHLILASSVYPVSDIPINPTLAWLCRVM